MASYSLAPSRTDPKKVEFLVPSRVIEGMTKQLKVGSELVKRSREPSYPSGTVKPTGVKVTIVGETSKFWDLSDYTLVEKTTLKANGSLFIYSVS